MKTKCFILTLSVFFISTFGLYASLIVTHGISETDFNDAFSNDRVWYAQFQPGGAGTTHPDNEFEIGGDTLRYGVGNTPIADKSNNPFEVNVSSSAFLTAKLNGIGIDGGFEYGITNDFNTIWVGLKFNAPNGFDNVLEINSHKVDGTAVLPDMLLEEQTSVWTAFKFYKDNDLVNIGEISITGNINPNMFLGGAADEDWTYTVFATQDTSIIPEPGTFALVLVGFIAALTCYRKKFN